MLTGFGIASITFGQFLFLGLSVFSLGILVHVTAGILFKSHMRSKEKKVFEMVLLVFIISFCSLLLLDYFDVLKIAL